MKSQLTVNREFSEVCQDHYTHIGNISCGQPILIFFFKLLSLLSHDENSSEILVAN